MTHEPGQIPLPAELEAEIPALLRGEPAAAERLARGLAHPLRQAAISMLGAASPDLEDVLQESIMAVLGYIRRCGGFEGSLIRFGVTVARNRCRNLLIWRRRRPQVKVESLDDWLAEPERSALDVLVEQEQLALLQEALDALGPDCRDLLHQLYIEQIPAEELRRRSGLRTVQGIHYRKEVCLERAFRILNERLSGCSTGEERERRRSRGRQDEDGEERR
jgi:RNA polymerase sigma factor (sigma-70 family)